MLRNKFGGLDCDPAAPAEIPVENGVTSITDSVEDMQMHRETQRLEKGVVKYLCSPLSSHEPQANARIPPAKCGHVPSF